MAYRICIFSANFLPNIGGVEKYTDNLARELARQGHIVTIVTNNVFNLIDKERLCERVTIVRLPCYNFLAGRLPIPKRNSIFAELMHSLESQRFDCISINTRFYPHTFIGIKFAEKQRVRPIVIDHGSAYLTLGSPLLDKTIALYEHAVTAILKRHDVDFYGVSAASVEWLSTFGIEAKGTLTNAIDAATFRNSASDRDFRQELGLAPDIPIVCFTGRFIPEKGIQQLYGAAKLLLNEGSPAHFLLAGAGPLEKTLTNNPLPNVHPLGKLSAEDIAALLTQSDVFCLPTRSEGFSTSLLEAAACATPAIITNVGGVQEMIPNGNYGLILKTADPTEIAAEVARLCADETLRREIGVNVQARVERKFTWSNVARQTLAACKAANRAH